MADWQLTDRMLVTLERLGDVYAHGRTETTDVDRRSAEALVRRGLASNRERATRVARDRREVVRYAITPAGLDALGRELRTEVRVHGALTELRRRYHGAWSSTKEDVAARVREYDGAELYQRLRAPEIRLDHDAADAVTRAAARVELEKAVPA